MANKKTDSHIGTTAARLAAINGTDMSAMMPDANKMLSPEAMKQVAMKHGGENAEKMMAAMGQAQELANGNMDFKQMAQMADKLGVDGHAGAFLKHVADTDPEKLAEVPGMVVDKETKKATFLGVEVPQQYAPALAAAYTYGLGHINRFLWDKSYKIGAHGAGAFSLGEAARHKTGMAAAIGAIGVATHWVDINKFIQNEKQYRKDYQKLATRLAPVLDDIKGAHSVSSLFRVSRDENEVIYNERRRMHDLNSAERVQSAVHAGGRAFQFGISMKEGYDKLGSNGYSEKILTNAAKHAEAEAAKHNERLAEKMGELKEQFEGVSPDKLLELAEKQLNPKADSGDKKSMHDSIKTLLPIGATLGAQMFGNAVLGTRTANIQPVSAYDMILALKKQTDDDLKAERYALPDGMHVEGRKGGDANALSLTNYIMQIFQQHEKDCDGEGKISDRKTERLQDVSHEISKAIRAGEMDAIALIGLVGDRKLVKSHGKQIANEAAVEREIAHYKDKMHYVDMVDEKEYYADASFTEEELKETWGALAEEEKDAFVGLVPTQILEAAGVDSKDIAARKEARKEQFTHAFAVLVENIAALEPKKLAELDVTKNEGRMLDRAHKAFERGGEDAIKAFMPSPKNADDISSVIAGVMVRQVAHGGTIKELVNHQEK